MSLQLEKDRRCFVCGEDNPHSLKLDVVMESGKEVTAVFIARERYRGWSNYLHGGILSLIFDELLGWMALYLGYDAVTARLEVRYRKPVSLGSRLIFTGALERETKGLLDIRLYARLEDRSVAAEGKGRLMIVNRNR